MRHNSPRIKGTGWKPVLLIMLLATTALAQPTSKQLWAEYEKNPDNHPNIPNVSYAGYRCGEAKFPEPKVVADVKKLGAAGDGKADDSAAFEQAIDAARKAGGGAITIPAGTYRLTRHLRLDFDNVVLRGAGSGRTILQFDKSLKDILGDYKSGSSRGWSWSGGLIWVGPKNDWEGNAPPADTDWEEWPAAEPVAKVNGAHARGDRTVTVDDATNLKPGDLYLMVWTDPADQSFVEHVGGHESMKGFDYGILAGRDWRWPVEVVAVKGNEVTLKQPIRVDIRPDWNVRFTPTGPLVREVGVEGLAIKCPPHPVAKHLQDVGFNGIYVNRAVHCWARDVAMENVDVGWGVSAAKNTTVTGLKITGQANHHATACRNGSMDNLVESFEIRSKPFHGLNTEGMSAGNVWRDGTMAAGTFDSHRLMSFDSVRTNITIANSGRPGGANHFGPFLGRRVVHWNLRVTGNGEWVAQPSTLVMGAVVGVQGVPIFEKDPWAMPKGDKGTIVADLGKAPTPVDLYTAQLELRLKTEGKAGASATASPTPPPKPGTRQPATRPAPPPRRPPTR
jgi:hypothetical protein